MDRMFPPPANNQPPRDPNGPHGPFGPYGPHGPHFPEPWHSHYGRYPYPYLHAPHGLHPFFGERPWDHIHCAPECDDQLPIFSTVGRGLRGDSYRVKVAYDAEGETYLEGGYYDANTNTYHTDWTSENINGGHLMYQYNLRTNTNPQTFTITFRYVRPERSESEWVWTTPAIPYIWDADNDGIGDTDNIVGAGVATLFLKKTTDSNWVTPSDANTPHTVAQAKNVQEKLLYPSGWTRSMFNSPAATKPWTVNLEYGVGGDIDVPTVEDLAKIIGVTPAYLREIVSERAIPVNIDFGHDGNEHPYNVKEYIDFHLHNDLFGNHSPNSLPDELGELKHDGSNTQQGYKNYGVWDWILWLKDYVDDNMLTPSHLHNDLFGNHSPNSLPDELGELKHDGDNTQPGYQNYGVWDWILWLKDHLHEDLFGNHGDASTPENQRQQGITYDIPHEMFTLLGDGGTKGVWDWVKNIINKLGFGDGIDSFDGLPNVTTVKQYIQKYVQSKITPISDPEMWTKTIPVYFVLYQLPTNVAADSLALSTSGEIVPPNPLYVDSSTPGMPSNMTSVGAIAGNLIVNYFDTLPDVYITFDIDLGTPTSIPGIFSKPGHLVVVCKKVSNKYYPFDLATIKLDHRGTNVYLKKPIFYAENLSNSGFLNPGDGVTQNAGMFSLYTGLGNVKATIANVDHQEGGETVPGNRNRDWPWTEESRENAGSSYNNNPSFFAYIFDRFGGGSTERIVQIDGFRNYDIKFTQAIRGQQGA